MCQAYESFYVDINFRDGANFVTYTGEELKDITDMDRDAGRFRTSPPLSLPTLADLCERVRRIGCTELPVTGVIVPPEENSSLGNSSFEVGQTSIENPTENVEG